MQEKNTWVCPVCGNRAYQRYGGVYVPAVEYYNGGKSKREILKKVGQHFMCKGCSVHFSNPKIFNAEKIKCKKDHMDR